MRSLSMPNQIAEIKESLKDPKLSDEKRMYVEASLNTSIAFFKLEKSVSKTHCRIAEIILWNNDTQYILQDWLCGKQTIQTKMTTALCKIFKIKRMWYYSLDSMPSQIDKRIHHRALKIKYELGRHIINLGKRCTRSDGIYDYES